MNVDFTNMETYQYFMMGGGILVVVAILLYFVVGKAKVSAFVATTLGCLALGFGAGIITLGAIGYNWNAKPNKGSELPDDPNVLPTTPKISPKGPDKKGGSAGKTQLVLLVTKLNQLTGAPLKIDLTEERKALIAKQLTDLDVMESLSDEVAQERLDALLVIVKDDLPILQKAGYGSGGGGGFGKKDSEPNPFKSAANKAELKSMQDRVGIKTPPG